MSFHMFEERVVIDGAPWLLRVFKDWSFSIQSLSINVSSLIYIGRISSAGEIEWDEYSHCCPTAIQNCVQDLVKRVWEMRLFL
jgi:hypothetical protein